MEEKKSHTKNFENIGKWNKKLKAHFRKQGKPPPPQEDGKKIMNET